MLGKTRFSSDRIVHFETQMEPWLEAWTDRKADKQTGERMNECAKRQADSQVDLRPVFLNKGGTTPSGYLENVRRKWMHCRREGWQTKP